MISQDFQKQVRGYGLTTAQILYRRPDHPWLLQTYVWQATISAPNFPSYTAFWNSGRNRSKVSCIRSRSHTAALSNRPISNRWTGCSGCIDQRPASLARTRPVTSPMRTPVRSERGCIAGDRAARATDGVPHATAKRLEQVPRRSRTEYDIDRGDRDGPVELTPQNSCPYSKH